MKQKILTGLVTLFIFQSCGNRNQSEMKSMDSNSMSYIFKRYSVDSIISKNFLIAYQNNSTAPSYIVFKVKDLNSGLIKEICCEAPFLSGAIHREKSIDYDSKGTEYVDSLILSNKYHFFEFKSKEALENVNFFNYPDSNKIIQYSQKLDLDKYYQMFSIQDSAAMMHFDNDTAFKQLMFAHIMFKCGIITNRDCEAGNNLWIGDPNR
jgi:hypothetical protein